MSTAAQIKRIHAMAGQAGLKDHGYRALLIEVGGVSSSKDLDAAGAERVIAALGRLGAGARSPANTASGPFAGKLQSLWISGWNLGVIREKDDRAMLAWLRERYGVDHPRFLIDAADAWPAIEGLKKWIAREGGVRWPSSGSPREAAHAVCDAIAAKLLVLDPLDTVGLRPCLHGASHGLPNRAVDYGTRDFHALANLLGARLRTRLAAQAAPPSADGVKARRGRCKKEHAA